jgi:hypothetical protein
VGSAKRCNMTGIFQVDLKNSECGLSVDQLKF